MEAVEEPEVAKDTAAAAKPPRGCSVKGCLLSGFLGLLVLILVGAAAAYLFYRSTVGEIKASEPFKIALELVQKDPQVAEELGGPIVVLFWPPPSRVANIDGDRGDAKLNFDVSGDKGTAHVEVDARMLEGKWGLSNLVVIVDKDGRRISVNTTESSPYDEAPLFKPGG